MQTSINWHLSCKFANGRTYQIVNPDIKMKNWGHQHNQNNSFHKKRKLEILQGNSGSVPFSAKSPKLQHQKAGGGRNHDQSGQGQVWTLTSFLFLFDFCNKNKRGGYCSLTFLQATPSFQTLEGLKGILSWHSNILQLHRLVCFASRVGLFVSSLFTETWSFCLFFSPIVNSSREEAADGSSTHCRAEGAAVHSSVKRKRKKQETSLFGIIFWTLFHFLIHGALAAKRLRLTFL